MSVAKGFTPLLRVAPGIWVKDEARIEGKKAMAYVLVEQLGGAVPDVVLYPTGGGTGLIGMGLRVPSPLGGFLCVQALRDPGGTVVAISDDEGRRATLELANRSGIDVCPEGGAAWAAREAARQWLHPRG